MNTLIKTIASAAIMTCMASGAMALSLGGGGTSGTGGTGGGSTGGSGGTGGLSGGGSTPPVSGGGDSSNCFTSTGWSNQGATGGGGYENVIYKCTYSGTATNYEVDYNETWSVPGWQPFGCQFSSNSGAPDTCVQECANDCSAATHP